ncbi:flavin monoamine oxidase family protein [Ideonella alba]|uniref:FAD-dependent oxidoreductase n=1 Tax=Ideonella alba TaxID=2824118 RepID=A0A941BG22_9BURK|nr:NAD(P)-binding protein [Ideonella alba]MBQ0930033.1 FAD-dependent oxidoreductase [Ideonella alba]
MRRRALLSAGAAAALAGCLPAPEVLLASRWVGVAPERGHRLRAPRPARADGPLRRVGALVLGGGVSGLAALRALVEGGVDDAQLLELDDAVGGNSRGHTLAGSGCPMGAHYLPVPGAAAPEVREWLQQIGLLRMTPRGLQPDERHLCHAPQERLFIDGAWQDGLLPSAEGRPATRAQYRRFAQAVAEAQRALPFAMPTTGLAWQPGHAALDAQRFDQWLQAQGLDDSRLLGHLDYCCRDDYGAGIASVSAWAGLHYFASRHGFAAPGEEAAERDAVFTWPEGNAALVRALATPLAPRLHLGRTVLAVEVGRHAVQVQAWNEAQDAPERWQAERVVVALPLHVAQHLVQGLDAPRQRALRETALATRHAPWLVANLQLDAWPLARTGAPLAWDNVPFLPAGRSPMLGYVHARHQSLRTDAAAEPPVITAYLALPETERGRLLSGSAADWTAEVLAHLAPLHPDLAQRLRQADLTRWGHAMAIPAPGVAGQPARRALREPEGRVAFVHTDLAGYSVFEEAFTLGARAGRTLARLG